MRTISQMVSALDEIAGAIEEIGDDLELPEVDRRIDWLMDHVEERRELSEAEDSEEAEDEDLEEDE